MRVESYSTADKFEDCTYVMVISSYGVGKSGLTTQPTWCGRAVLMCTISARSLMTFKAECFAVGRFVSAAAAYCCAVMRLPSSALALFVVLKHKILSAAFTLAVSVVEDLAFGFFGKSHLFYFLKRLFSKPTIQECVTLVRCHSVAFAIQKSKGRANAKMEYLWHICDKLILLTVSMWTN